MPDRDKPSGVKLIESGPPNVNHIPAKTVISLDHCELTDLKPISHIDELFDSGPSKWLRKRGLFMTISSNIEKV